MGKRLIIKHTTLGFLGVFFLLLFLTSCEDQDPILDTDPSIDIAVGNAYEERLYEPGTFLKPIEIELYRGTHALETVQVMRNGEALLSDWDVLDEDENPRGEDPSQIITLDEDQAAGAILSIGIKLSEEVLTDEYSFEVSDVEGNMVESESLSITTKLSRQSLDTIYTEKLLLNAAGHVSSGGLDLDLGIGTGSEDERAEIQDLGIDIDKPIGENWIQKFRGVNGAELVKLGESFDLESIRYKDDLVYLFQESSIIDETPEVAVGDYYVVRKGGGSRHYLLRVTEVHVTEADNEDYYQFDIRY